ncbi:MAG: N-acetyl-gamma-glutamyl-phosphate reductase, partial [Halobacteriota archaeon]
MTAETLTTTDETLANATAGVLGGSGYVGGELLRLLAGHPGFEVAWATSRDRAGRSVGSVHPNLRGLGLRFVDPADMEPVDVLFAALPHGAAAGMIDELLDACDVLVDLSADFRLDDADAYESWYGKPHPAPELLEEAVYALAEVNREAIADASVLASGGCNATATILGLLPLADAGLLETADPIVVDVKVGSSEGGASGGVAASHVERSGVVRPYAPTSHRHEAEIEGQLGTGVSFTAHAVDMVRGASATCHVFVDEVPPTADCWGMFRSTYEDEPFVRLQAGGGGVYRYPEPKAVAGSNMAEV